MEWSSTFQRWTCSWECVGPRSNCRHQKKRLPRWLSVKKPPANAGDVGSIPGLGSSPREESGNPLQYSCLENPMGRGTWQPTVQGAAKSQTQLRTETTARGRREPAAVESFKHQILNVCKHTNAKQKHNIYVIAYEDNLMDMCSHCAHVIRYRHGTQADTVIYHYPNICFHDVEIVYFSAPSQCYLQVSILLFS